MQHRNYDINAETAIGYLSPIKQGHKHTSERHQFSLAPTLNTQQTGNQAQQQALQTQGNVTQQNQYTPGQAALESQLTGGYSNLINGNIPTSYTANPALIGAYQTAYNQTAPATAMQGGAGSPQLQSNYAQGLQSLLANQYNTGVSNYQNALSGASSNALSSVGSNQQNFGSTQASSYGTGNTNSSTQQPLSILAALLGY